MKRLFKFLFLRPGDLLLAVKTSILLALIRFGLWLLPFSVLQQLLANLNQRFSKSSSSSTKIEADTTQVQDTFALSPKNKTTINKIIWAVNVSSKYMPGKVKCLARALTTEFLMNRWGYSPELRIGVAKGKAGKLEAHAWIESQGKVLIGQLEDLTRFQILPLPPSKLMVK